ncbi:MAG TPA: GDSL-type esterase/lipase family protein [Bryobacteraceae bacterium]|jgi:lysophospholipase L1-like esterase|nr:GDSL-type esterase/lipase family protein [Bryobacteraceae bacterium]
MRFPISTGLTILIAGALLTLSPKLAPALKAPRIQELASLADFSPERTPMSPLERHVEAAPAPVFHLRANGAAPLLEDSNGGLDHFYAALARTERREPGAITRVSHYGDSPTTADLITGDLRAMLQARYGDAGHGFILLAKPWAWYQHRGASLSSSGWQIFPATRFEIKDGIFGLGGVNFMGNAGAKTEIELDDSGQSNFDLYFESQPNGGTVEIFANGETAEPLDRISTASDRAAADFASFEVPHGASSIELKADGPVRLFGITAEKSGPGVVYDSIGLNGASITVLSRMFNAAHWSAELQHRHPDLVTINYGTNEADFTSFIDKQYEKELREAIRRVRAALPESSILVMSPMDRGYRTGPGDIETMETIPRIVEIQRRVAAATGCGFFDTFDAMGGAGTMARWYNAQPRLVSADFIHPNPAGGKIVAAALVKQMEMGLSRYKLRRMQN